MIVRDITVYEEATGRIILSGSSCIPEDGYPLAAGHALLLDVSTDRPGLHYVKAGALVAMPARPSDAHEFDYSREAWVSNDAMAWGLVRIERDRLLKATDWMVTKAVETGEPMPPGVATYRQALRDITSQSDPHAIVWPQIAPPD